MVDWLEQVTLDGTYVRLEPLRDKHVDELMAAADGDFVAWRWMPRPAPSTRDDMRALIDGAARQHAAGDRIAWAVVEQVGGRAIGSTSFLDIDPDNRRVEIGWTWYGRRWWSGPVNPECKLLLMTRAFDVLGARRVAFKTDAANQRSQVAITRLGATREGVLRAHMMRSDGSRRDTVYFSVLDREWPDVRDGLRARLTAAGT